MSRFHEELIAARREGTAPPQVEQIAATQEPREEIVFTASSIPGAYICQACYALVDSRLTGMHSAWHIDTDTA